MRTLNLAGRTKLIALAQLRWYCDGMQVKAHRRQFSASAPGYRVMEADVIVTYSNHLGGVQPSQSRGDAVKHIHGSDQFTLDNVAASLEAALAKHKLVPHG